MEKYNKYKKKHNEIITCDVCKKKVGKCHIRRHNKSQFHKIVLYCKNKIIHYNIHGTINNK